MNSTTDCDDETGFPSGASSADGGCPVGEFAAAKYGSLAWERYGLKGIRDKSFPAPGQVVAGDGVSYHLRVGKHDLTLWDWSRYIDFADAHGWSRAIYGIISTRMAMKGSTKQ